MKLNNFNNKEIFKISFIVCSNGFGHFKRALDTSISILKYKKNTHITIFCTKKHIELVLENINFKIPIGSNIYFCTDIFKYEINFLNIQKNLYTKYQKWIKVLSNNKILLDSNLIISDNHIAPLNAFKNVILMGSFIWHDLVESKDKDYKKIIFLEKKILFKYKPTIICLENMAMNHLVKYTNQVFAPWFTKKYNYKLKKNQKNCILITGGGTSFQDSILINISKYILQNDQEIIIYFDNKLFNKINILNKRVKLFSFTDNNFIKLKAILCRPGIGILTDCVKYSIPAIAINENTNSEISNNAFNIERHKLGVSILTNNETTNSDAGSQILSFLNNNKELHKIRNSFKKQKYNGSDFAANFIIKKYINNESN